MSGSSSSLFLSSLMTRIGLNDRGDNSVLRFCINNALRLPRRQFLLVRYGRDKNENNFLFLGLNAVKLKSKD